MSLFLFLALVNALTAGLALLRGRPAVLILSGNLLTVLVALDHIQTFGQPHSQQFLPGAVFSLGNLEIAGYIMAITTAFTFLAGAWRGPPPGPAPVLPRLPTWIMVLLVLYFLAVIFSQRTIFTHGYVDPERTIYGLNLSGAHALLASAFLYEFVRRSIMGELSRPVAFGIVFTLFIATDFLKGSTGLASGFVAVAALLILGGEPRPVRRMVWLGAAMLGLVLLSIAVRQVRMNLHDVGPSMLSTVMDTLTQADNTVARNAEGVESTGNGSQYAAHLLECVSLYEAGVSREWRSVYLPIVYTLQPSFLAGVLGFVRSKEAPWELGEYYVHGGGIFVPGELYWNGGYLCVALVFGALAWFSWRSDTGRSRSFPWLLVVCTFTPNLLQGLGYGFAQVSRGIFNSGIALLIWAIARRWTRRRTAAPVPSAAIG